MHIIIHGEAPLFPAVSLNKHRDVSNSEALGLGSGTEVGGGARP